MLPALLPAIAVRVLHEERQDGAWVHRGVGGAEVPLRQVFGLRGTNHSTIHLQPRLPILGGQCLCTSACGLRSPIPLHDSPGITPGSLLPQPRKWVVVPKIDTARNQPGDSRDSFGEVWLACRVLLSSSASYPAWQVILDPWSGSSGPWLAARRAPEHPNC
jgi:hypothetical protein